MGAAVLLALVVGVAIAVQAATLGALSSSLRPLAISMALLAPGLAIGAVWATARGAWPDVAAVARQWWWVPLGVAGWLIVAAIGVAASRLGVATALATIVGAQLAAGLAHDVWRGGLGLSARPLLALGLVVAGVWLLHRPGP